MGYENFNQTNQTSTNGKQLNFCDIFELGTTLKNDLTTYGPGMLKELQEAPIEAKIALGAALPLVAVGVAAASTEVGALAGAGAVVCGLGAAGSFAMHELHKHFPSVQIEDSQKH